MRKLLFLFCSFFGVVFSFETVPTPEEFMKLYPKAYQDIIVQNRVLQTGDQECAARYEMIQPILNTYKKPFSVLDIGAYEGYFSFKIAEEYPQAVVVPLEGGVYAHAPLKLHRLCRMNAHLKNLLFLHHSLTLESLKELNKTEHFDVILALLVIHQIAEQKSGKLVYMQRAQKCIEGLFQLGNDVIIEVSLPDVYPELAMYVDELCKKKQGTYFGQVYRKKQKNQNCLGKLYWFKNTHVKNATETGISLDTFRLFGGTYPSSEEIQKLIQAFPNVSARDLIIKGQKVEPRQR